ncbi:AMPKBI-domain-containing protein [Tothia fuscella]|uniref:AMPKBI-domain-containing protein n=1 Tax=Tothia fuscella TaxID=1048955 RepID=A0A9P4U2U9_9PEZI|nr:AMPKBI-domain-containing protein [Tothia fuscella]
MGNQESKPKQQQHKRVQSSPAKSSPLPKPIDIAAPPADKQAQIPQQNEPLSPSVVRSASLADESYQLPSAQYNRPPRLPLPIEEELHTPGSPILSPADVAAVEPLDGLPKRSSLLSNIAADEDDLGDDVDILAGGLHPPVPTLIEWREAGNKVYVTGTFAGWDRKFRLKENKHPGALSATIHLQPGTHHVRFIVDNDLKLSKFMPTAVDFTNYLVNYIEVVPETDKAAAPVEGADVPSGDKQPPQPVQPSDPRPIEYRAPPGVHPPHVLPPTPELVAVPPKEASPKPAVNPTSQAVQVAPVPEKKYHSEIPRFLLDIDTPEDSSRYARANAVLNTAPTPPTLPMFLNKSILNGTTPMKDDASVLNMPNHTMLNHLATSSIKQKVLATSATTRYKRKFLTTIMYKPTSSVGE